MVIAMLVKDTEQHHMDSHFGVWFAFTCLHLYIQGGREKNATPTINNLKKTRERMKKGMCIISYKILLYTSKMTPRSLILMKAF